jgi:hypothetical protein
MPVVALDPCWRRKCDGGPDRATACSYSAAVRALARTGRAHDWPQIEHLPILALFYCAIDKGIGVETIWHRRGGE